MDKIVVDVVEIRVEQLIRENFLTVEHVFTARTCLNLASGAALGSAAGAVTATAVAWAGSAVVSKWRKWREANDADDQDRKQPVKETRLGLGISDGFLVEAEKMALSAGKRALACLPIVAKFALDRALKQLNREFQRLLLRLGFMIGFGTSLGYVIGKTIFNNLIIINEELAVT